MKGTVGISLSVAAVAAIVSASFAAAAPALNAWNHSAVAQAPDGKTLYEANCKKCHGVIGNPPKTMKAKFPKIATFDEEFKEHHSQDSVVKILTVGKNEDMKSFKDKLTADERTAVAKYVLELAGKK